MTWVTWLGAEMGQEPGRRAPCGFGGAPCGFGGAPCGFGGAPLRQERSVMHERRVLHPAGKRSWLKRALWLIWCTIGPQINHEARNNHNKHARYRINIRNM